jgi:hypothetical protein
MQCNDWNILYVQSDKITRYDTLMVTAQYQGHKREFIKMKSKLCTVYQNLDICGSNCIEIIQAVCKYFWLNKITATPFLRLRFV